MCSLFVPRLPRTTRGAVVGPSVPPLSEVRVSPSRGWEAGAGLVVTRGFVAIHLPTCARPTAPAEAQGVEVTIRFPAVRGDARRSAGSPGLRSAFDEGRGRVEGSALAEASSRASERRGSFWPPTSRGGIADVEGWHRGAEVQSGSVGGVSRRGRKRDGGLRRDSGAVGWPMMRGAKGPVQAK